MKKRKLMVWAIIPAVALFFVVVLLAGGRSQDEQLHIRDYTDVKVAGLDGNGRVTCVLRTEELYPEIAGDEKNAVLLDMYTRLLESVKYKVEGSNGRLKEGDSVHVKVSLDEELAKECGVELIAVDVCRILICDAIGFRHSHSEVWREFHIFTEFEFSTDNC